MGIIYIITDIIRLHRSIFKIGKTQNENLRALETRYRNTIKEPILLGFVDVGTKYEFIERILLDSLMMYRINHGGKGESEWVQLPYYILVLLIKFVSFFAINSNYEIKGFSFNILPEHCIVDTTAVDKKSLQELQTMPLFFQHRLVNHTQNLSNFEPDIFATELLFIPYIQWSDKMKSYYSQFRAPLQIVNNTILESIKSYFYPQQTIVPEKSQTKLPEKSQTKLPEKSQIIVDLSKEEKNIIPPKEILSVDQILINIKNTYLGDKKFVNIYAHMITKYGDKLFPYREHFDAFIDFLITKYGTINSIVTIDSKLLDDFIQIRLNAHLGGTKSYTYILKYTCNHIMISGKNKGRYCNRLTPINNEKCSKHF